MIAHRITFWMTLPEIDLREHAQLQCRWAALGTGAQSFLTVTSRHVSFVIFWNSYNNAGKWNYSPCRTSKELLCPQHKYGTLNWRRSDIIDWSLHWGSMLLLICCKPRVHVNRPLTCISYLSILLDYVDPFMRAISLTALAYCSSTQNKMAQQEFYKHTKNSDVSSKFPQISIQHLWYMLDTHP